MKTLFTLTFALTTGVALGTTTTFTDLSSSEPQNQLNWNPSTCTLTQVTGATENNLFNPSGGGANYPEISLSFTLNLTQLGKISDTTDLVRINIENNDVGILWTGSGIKGIWQNTNSYGNETSLDTLLSNANVFTVGGSKYLTVTMTSAKHGSTATNGVQVYDVSGGRVFSAPKLGTDNSAGKSISDVTVNTGIINMFSVTNSWLNANDAKAQAATLNTASKEALEKAVPEPATATLSLLALAGLAARRRRK